MGDRSGSNAALAAAAFPGLLLALPASAALWFGDLRDRGLAAAVEGYTRTHVSPLLLAHELAVLQVSCSNVFAPCQLLWIKALPALLVALWASADGRAWWLPDSTCSLIPHLHSVLTVRLSARQIQRCLCHSVAMVAIEGDRF